MSNNNNRNRGVTGKASKPNVMAYAGFNTCEMPYSFRDLYVEPTQRRIRELSSSYVPFLTFDNWALDNFFAIAENSPTTHAIIKQKTEYSMGDGFIAVPSANNEVLPLIRTLRNVDIDQDAAEALNDYAKSVNVQGDTLEEVTRCAFNELYAYGNAFILLKMFDAGGDKFATLENLPIYFCRPMKCTEGRLYPTHIGFSEDFQENEIQPSTVVNYPLFPLMEEVEGVVYSVIQLKVKNPNFTYWGLPDWAPAKIWGEIEYRIPKFNQSMFENGFTPSAIISLFGATNNEEAQQLVNGLKSCFTNTGNNGKMFVQALRDETQKADVQVLNNTYQGQFLDLQNMAFDAIVAAHRWTRSLTGLRQAGSLGSNQQIRAEFDIAYNTVIRPMQRMVLGKFINPVLDVIGDYLGHDWHGIDLDISKPMPISFMADIDPTTVLTMDEMREALGYEPLNNNQNALEDGNTN